jgi:hypothetical protein
MQTVLGPASIRDQAAAVILRHLGPARSERNLSEVGAEILSDLLIELEKRFGVDLEAWEVFPQVTGPDLADLVEAKVRTGQIRGWLIANDVVSAVRPPARPQAWDPRPPMFPAPPPAHAVRAGRIFDAEFRARARLKTLGLLCLFGAVVGALAAGVAFLAGWA